MRAVEIYGSTSDRIKSQLLVHKCRKFPIGDHFRPKNSNYTRPENGDYTRPENGDYTDRPVGAYKKSLVQARRYEGLFDERGDVPGWVLVVLMTTGLVTAIWTIAAPRLSTILKNSLDAMNGIR